MGIRLKKALIVGVLLVILLATFQWLYTHGTLEIVVSNANDSELSYSLTRQPSGKPNESQSKNKTIKKYVSKGKYEVKVTQGSSGYFSVAETGGFLKKTRIEAKLTPERNRVFICDNPSECMFFDNLLYSYDCAATTPFGAINVHTAANESAPTLLAKLALPNIDGLVEGLIKTSFGNVAMIHFIDVEGSGGRGLYLLDSNLKTIKSRHLDQLTALDPYALAVYKTGFIIYNLDANFIDYFSSFDAEPQQINLQKPVDVSGYLPLSFGTGGDYIWLFLSNLSNQDSEGEINSRDIKNTLLFSDGKSSRTTNLDKKLVLELFICASNRLCLLSDRSFEIYELGDRLGKILYSVTDVQRLELQNNTMLFVRSKDILRIDPVSLSGLVDYSFGDYKYCGLSKQDLENYVLCVADTTGRKRVLLINNEPATDDIDKKIIKLAKLNELAAVSAYKGFIYLTPELGGLVYDTATGGYTYDPTTKLRVNQKINDEINRLGIDRKKYTIINTSE